jgi:bacillithiol synthase
MLSSSSLLSYQKTGFFNDIVTAYLQGETALQPFYAHPVNREGLLAAMLARESFATDRNLLVSALKMQYSELADKNSHKVAANIDALLQPNTFTVCTAHQPNIFTGYLYFIYKIIHAIKLADYLKKEFPQNNFVPVYYMGSEDADLEELGKIFLNGEKLVWPTKQTGAVGRMDTGGIDLLIHRIEGELSVQPHGPALIGMLKTAYQPKTTVQAATFNLLHQLFAQFGLVVLIADRAELKQKMQAVFLDDLLHQVPAQIVTATNKRLSASYKVQANPREINLFYLKDNIRNRIERSGDLYTVVDTNISFSRGEIESALSDHPERFSPNVILRGLYQETILPNIAFIGGGGELAYWLELKDLFAHYQVPYPVQVLRNSVLLVEEQWQKKIAALGFGIDDLFLSTTDLINTLVKRDSTVQVHLSNEIRDAHAYYEYLKNVGGAVDKTLTIHISALEKKMVRQLEALEKKILRAAKRKFTDQERQISTVKKQLFPNNNLQERIENFMPFYAKFGPQWLQVIYDHALVLEQQFQILSIDAN